MPNPALGGFSSMLLFMQSATIAAEKLNFTLAAPGIKGHKLRSICLSKSLVNAMRVSDGVPFDHQKLHAMAMDLLIGRFR